MPEDSEEERDRLLDEIMSMEFEHLEECCERHPRCLTCPYLSEEDFAMTYHRNEPQSRATILKRLATYPKGRWVTCRDAVGHCGEGGPWSEDLQALVVEGKIESQVPLKNMSPVTLVRLK